MTDTAPSGGQDRIPDTAATIRIPEVIASEDGDYWFLVGHVTEAEARLALLAHMLHPEWGYGDRDESYETALTARVRRPYMKPDPTDPNEEQMTECAMSDPEAIAFTILEAVDG